MSAIRYEIRTILAGAAALAGVGTAHADALPLPSGGVAYYLSGSTAMDNAVKATLLQGTGGICGTTPDVYIDSTAADITKGHNTTIVCTINKPLGGTLVPSGTVVAFDKESNGGSLEGILPISQGVGLKFFNPANSGAALGCTTSTTVPGLTNTSTNPYSFTQTYVLHYGCTAPTTTAVPNIGLADENAQSFNYGTPSVTAADVAKVSSTQFVQNVFGIGVSTNLYRALQRSQGYTPVGAAADDALANMPTLSTNAIRALYTGQTTSWAGITDAAGNAINSSTDTGGVGVSSTVYLCRRGDSSGTNTSVDIKFRLNPRCTSSNGGNSVAMRTASTSAANCKGYISSFGSFTGLAVTEYGCAWVAASNGADQVFAGFGGSDVQSCLSYHDTQNQFAIGNLTTNAGMSDVGGTGGSADTSTSTTGRFRFVKIDGHTPDLGAVVNGSYDFVMDNIIVVSKTAGQDTLDLQNYITTLYFTQPNLVRDFMATQPVDTNFTAGVLLDQNQATVSGNLIANGGTLYNANTTPPYVTGSQVKSGLQGTTAIYPISPFTQLQVNASNPQDCAPAIVVPNPGVPAAL